MVLGLVLDSLYQMISPTAVMPQRLDLGPPGEAHSVTLPVLGSRRPRQPQEETEFQMMSSVGKFEFSPGISILRPKPPVHLYIGVSRLKFSAGVNLPPKRLRMQRRRGVLGFPGI